MSWGDTVGGEGGREEGREGGEDEMVRDRRVEGKRGKKRSARV